MEAEPIVRLEPPRAGVAPPTVAHPPIRQRAPLRQVYGDPRD